MVMEILTKNLFIVVFLTLLFINIMDAWSKSRKEALANARAEEEKSRLDDEDYHYDESAEKLRRDPAAYASRVRQDSHHELTEEDYYFANIAEHERQFELSSRNNQA